MRDLPPGWATELAVLELAGSTVDESGDHLAVRTPDNPEFHWGNFLLVTDPGAVADAGRWVRAFEHAFPLADWIAVGLVAVPEDPTPWEAAGLAVELNEVLTTQELPRRTPRPAGYAVRRLREDDWGQSVARMVAESERTGEAEPQSHERYACARVGAWRTLSDRDVAAFFGAFADEVLIAELGIVRCGTTARYQNVGTDEGHRGRGLASHLLGVAARWAGDRGCDRFVILTEEANPAGRIYRKVGFTRGDCNAAAYRKPAPASR